VSQHLVPQDFFTKPDNQSQALRLNALFVDAAAKCARGASAMTLDDAKPLLLTGDPVTMPVPVPHQADPNNNNNNNNNNTLSSLAVANSFFPGPIRATNDLGILFTSTVLLLVRISPGYDGFADQVININDRYVATDCKCITHI